MPRATWGDVKAFCRRMGHTESNGDHLYFDVGLPNGSSSGTMVSHGVRDTDPIPKTYWKLIWHKQLRLQTEADFWSGLNGDVVNWNIPPTPLLPTPLWLYLRRFLAEKHYYNDEQIAQTSREDPQAMYDESYADEASD